MAKSPRRCGPALSFPGARWRSMKHELTNWQKPWCALCSYADASTGRFFYDGAAALTLCGTADPRARTTACSGVVWCGAASCVWCSFVASASGLYRGAFWFCDFSLQQLRASADPAPRDGWGDEGGSWPWSFARLRRNPQRRRDTASPSPIRGGTVDNSSLSYLHGLEIGRGTRPGPPGHTFHPAGSLSADKSILHGGHWNGGGLFHQTRTTSQETQSIGGRSYRVRRGMIGPEPVRTATRSPGLCTSSLEPQIPRRSCGCRSQKMYVPDPAGGLFGFEPCVFRPGRECGGRQQCVECESGTQCCEFRSPHSEHSGSPAYHPST